MPPDERPPFQVQPRQRWLDRDLVVAVSAIVISLSALLVSLVQTRVMMAQKDAAVWPRLVVWSSLRQQGGFEVAVGVKNAGVGPLQVRWAQVTLSGHPITNALALLDSAPPPAGPGENTATHASLTGTVLTPSEDREILRVSGPIAQQVATLAPRTGFTVCYCSIYDKCWTHESQQMSVGSAAARITAVAACIDPVGPVF
ncbi:MAG: hypothetical protein IPK85_11425 [Gemmatimonadetes bacterium]|nr:hypothetical protein [Gemmatimonadota bacterium]